MNRPRLFLRAMLLAVAGLALVPQAALPAGTAPVQGSLQEAPSAGRADPFVAPAGEPGAGGLGRADEPGGAGVSDYRLGEATEPRSLLWDSLRLLLTLAAVLGLFGICLKLFQRWGHPWGQSWGMTGGRSLTPGALEVLGRLSLGSKETVCLVRVGAEVLVVGVCPQGLSLLHRVDGGSLGLAAPAGGPEASRRLQGGTPLSPLRLRELARRLRDVQAAWGLRESPRGGDR